ncbi:hypothetical protein L1857_14400 [Amycolatopsis thermalba]|uniref:Uncharacterized protein n=1 Tax=Amycolatopsis thermalba TaxID=944492 RepID=A0ABY4NV51_9PSEU|nr:MULTISPECIES: hypothetical protein [Amycolatopsis]UQS23939.1 hypothetical protein L1857_14400 [Amycolatopsis thermalba]
MGGYEVDPGALESGIGQVVEPAIGLARELIARLEQFAQLDRNHLTGLGALSGPAQVLGDPHAQTGRLHLLAHLREAVGACGHQIHEAAPRLFDDGGVGDERLGEHEQAVPLPLGVLTAITGAVVTVATGGAALPAFATAVLAAGDEAGKQAVALDGVSYASVADTRSRRA